MFVLQMYEMLKVLRGAGLISQIGHWDSTSGKISVSVEGGRKITFTKKSQIFNFAEGCADIQNQLRSLHLQDDLEYVFIYSLVVRSFVDFRCFISFKIFL